MSSSGQWRIGVDGRMLFDSTTGGLNLFTFLFSQCFAFASFALFRISDPMFSCI